MTCTHPLRELELLDMELGMSELQTGSTNGWLRDLARGERKFTAKVKCKLCGEHFDLIKCSPFESGDWSKLQPGTLHEEKA